MIEAEASWGQLVRGRLAACRWRLLVVQLLVSAAGFGVLFGAVALRNLGQPAVSQVVLLTAASLLAAWGWSASLKILDGGQGLWPALRPVARIGLAGCCR
jgi:hypothetical protein